MLWNRASLVMMLIMFMAGMFSGYGRALMPIAAVQVFEFSTADWAELNAVMGFAGAVVALFLGPVIDRRGAKSVMGLTILLAGVHAFTLASTPEERRRGMELFHFHCSVCHGPQVVAGGSVVPGAGLVVATSASSPSLEQPAITAAAAPVPARTCCA